LDSCDCDHGLALLATLAHGQLLPCARSPSPSNRAPTAGILYNPLFRPSTIPAPQTKKSTASSCPAFKRRELEELKATGELVPIVESEFSHRARSRSSAATAALTAILCRISPRFIREFTTRSRSTPPYARQGATEAAPRNRNALPEGDTASSHLAASRRLAAPGMTKTRFVRRALLFYLNALGCRPEEDAGTVLPHHGFGSSPTPDPDDFSISRSNNRRSHNKPPGQLQLLRLRNQSPRMIVLMAGLPELAKPRGSRTARRTRASPDKDEIRPLIRPRRCRIFGPASDFVMETMLTPPFLAAKNSRASISSTAAFSRIQIASPRIRP